jgi:tetratricopeptide (TPR) repeat protein
MESQPLILQEFLRRRLVTADEYKQMSAEVEVRIKEVWGRVMQGDPRNPFGYVGLAYSKHRSGDTQGGLEVAVKGLDVCGSPTELIVAVARLLREADPQKGLEFLRGPAGLKEQDFTPPMCQVYADVALRAARPDLALTAVRRALKQDPTLYWARHTEGEICLRLGKPTEAAAALAPIRDQLAKDPAGCSLYVRALCECESYQLAEEFLEQVKAENRPADVLLTAAEGLQKVGRHEDAARWAKQVLAGDRTNVRALTIAAFSLYALAGQGERGWDGNKVHEALLNYRQVLLQQPNNLVAVNNVVCLELKALGRAKDAYESSAPLRAVQDRPDTPADYLETLGAVYLANDQPELARQMLTRALESAGPRASFYIHLALAHHGLKQSSVAVELLRRAADLPKTPREWAELREAAQVIGR